MITTLKIPPSKAWRRLHRANATSPRVAHCIASRAVHRIANNPRTDNQPAAHRPPRTAHTSHLQLEGTPTHKEAANLQMNQSDMKEAVKTAILQHDHVLLNLTSIILSMANNHDSIASFSARCLAAEMLSVEVKTKGEDGNVTRDTHHVNLEQAYRTRTFAREILFFMAEEVRSGIREDFMKSKFFGHALDEATAKTKNQHVIQYICTTQTEMRWCCTKDTWAWEETALV